MITRLKSISPTFFYSAFGLLIIYHLATLNVSPTALFDEVFFAAIAQSFAETGKLYQPIVPQVYEGQQVLLYGPVYFWLTGLSFKIFGLGIFQFRIINLLFSGLSIWLFVRIAKKQYNHDRFWLLLLALLMSLNNFYHASSHSGRMDAVALFFVLASTYLALELPRTLNRTPKSLAAGGLAALAILTTPRIGVLIFGVCCLLLFRWIKYRKSPYFRDGLYFALGLVIMYLPWFFWAFGSLDNLLEYYGQFSHFAGQAQFRIVALLLPIQGAAALVVAISLLPRREGSHNELVLLSLFTILIFHLVVRITSAHYYLLILPYYFFLIAGGISLEKRRWAKRAIFAMLLVIGVTALGIFTVKTANIITTYKLRSPKDIELFVQEHIPPNSKVIGDYAYFYAVKKGGANFVASTYEINTTPELTEDYLSNVYDFEYFITAPSNTEGPVFSFFSERNELKEIARFEATRKKTLFEKYFPIPFTINTSYDCILYRRSR